MGEEKDGEGERIIDGVLQNRTTRFAAVCIFTGEFTFFCKIILNDRLNFKIIYYHHLNNVLTS